MYNVQRTAVILILHPAITSPLDRNFCTHNGTPTIALGRLSRRLPLKVVGVASRDASSQDQVKACILSRINSPVRVCMPMSWHTYFESCLSY